MRLFRNSESIEAEISDMERDENPRREDRAIVSKFFNGAPPLSQGEADAMGLKVNVNNLFGYTDLATSKEATLALYTKPPRLFNVALDFAPVGKRHEWEQKVTAAFNRRLKKSNRLKSPYEGVAGDATMHGSGCFFFPDPRTPYPRQLALSQLLVPSKSPADPRDLTHFAIETELSIHEIMRHIRRESEGWKKARLQSLAKAIFNKADKKAWSGRAITAVENMNPEEMEYARQESVTIDRTFRTSVPVYYFYQSDPDRDGRPLDLTILAKVTDGDEDRDKKRGVLFEESDFFPSVTDAIQPFFMDCILGGSPKWHRVKGQGHLNYSIAWHIELFVSRLMQGGMESMMDVWQASDAANREDLERILMKHNGIIPEGVNLLQNRRVTDFNGVLQVLNILKAAGARNSQAAGSTVPDAGGDELEVQALFRQGQITAQQSSRQSNWYDYFGNLGDTIFSRFTNPDIMSSDRDYSEVNEFQSEMQREGIPLYYLQKHNVTVTAHKITGDGNESKAMAAAAFGMQNMQMYPPESQGKLKRIVTGIMFDDYNLAEELLPLEDKPDGGQVRDADNENNTCIIQGRPPEIQAKDIDETHIGVHVQGLQSILQKAAQNGETFTPDGLQAFKALGGHTIAHIQRMESMQKKEPAAQMMDQMNQLAKMAEKFRHNMEQQMQAQQEQGAELDPIEVARLELDQDRQALAREKNAFQQEKFERTQALREHGASLDNAHKMSREAREEEKQRVELAEKDVRLALDVTSNARPAASPDK